VSSIHGREHASWTEAGRALTASGKYTVVCDMDSTHSYACLMVPGRARHQSANTVSSPARAM
jgi:hypothetical protein